MGTVLKTIPNYSDNIEMVKKWILSSYERKINDYPEHYPERAQEAIEHAMNFRNKYGIK
jgi:hypothetical protein